MVANQGKITNLAGTPSTGLVDGTDKLHSGILKTLESFSQGDMCISHAGFTITDAGTYTQYNLAQPIKFTSKGQYVSYTGGNLTVVYSSTVADASNDRYDWVLLNPNIGGTPAIVIVQGTAASAPLVADITAGYIPIALVKIDAGSTNDATSRNFQLYTMSKVSNSLSIGHNDSGYTEAMSITSSAGDVSIENKVQDKDIIIKGNDEGVSTTIATFDVSATKLLVPNRIETNVLLLGYGTGPAKLQVYNAGDDLELYAAGDSGGNVKILELDAGTDGTEANRIATVTGNLHVSTNVGIGTTSPSEMLHLSDADASEPTILIENTGTSTSEPNLTFSRTGTHPSDPTVDIGRILFKGDNTVNADTEYVMVTADAHVATDGDERGRMRFHVMRAGAITEVLRLGGYEVTVNESSNDVDFRVEGNTVTNLLKVNAGADTVGIGSDAPDHTLTVNGTVGIKGLVQNVTTVAGNANPPAAILPQYDILDTDNLIIASAPAGGVPALNDLILALPDAGAEDIGRTYRIIAKAIGGSGETLKINRTGSDDVITDHEGATLSLPYALTAGKIYDVTCVDADLWMLMLLN